MGRTLRTLGLTSCVTSVTAHYLRMQIMTLKRMNWVTFLTQCHLNLCDFPTNFPKTYRSSFSIPLRLFTYEVFFKCYFKNPCFQLKQNVSWTNEMTCVISASAGINGVSLAHFISKTSSVTYRFYYIYWNIHW